MFALGSASVFVIIVLYGELLVPTIKALLKDSVKFIAPILLILMCTLLLVFRSSFPQGAINGILVLGVLTLSIEYLGRQLEE